MLPRKKSSPQSAAIEVGRSKLHLAVVERRNDEGPQAVRVRSIVWRQTSSAAYSDLGLNELAAAVTSLIHEERLAGGEISFTLGGDHCVTRVAVGTLEHVRRELRLLEERSAVYLAPGRGRKALADCMEPLDARHHHAMLSVTNEKLLSTLVQVAARSGVAIDRVEPSLVALSRAMGHSRRDAEAPLLIVNITEGGVQLGISLAGRLLLDYHPSGKTDVLDPGQIVAAHLERLQRWCERYYGFTSKRLERAVLVGSSEAVDRARGRFAERTGLAVELFNAASMNPGWTFAGGLPGAEHAAALGTCLVEDLPSRGHAGPNLMDRIRRNQREPLLQGLARRSWPIGVAAVVAVILLTLNLVEGVRSRLVLRQLESVEQSNDRAWLLRTQMAQADARVHRLRQIEGTVFHPAWDELLTVFAQCLPENAWLDRLTVTTEGLISISGTSYSDEAAYSFVRWLETAPHVRRVVLEGTAPAKFGTYSATTFDV
ncbi:MAG: PilN domain-containing protein, partial [Pirellulales bacterium]